MTAPVEYKVRKASLDDVIEIAQIHVNVWHEAFKGLMPQGYIDGFTLESRSAEWLTIIKDKLEVVLVAELKGRIAGFLSYRYETEDSFKTIEVSRLYLTPSDSGKGLGSLLLSALYDDIAELDATLISLYVMDNNLPALSFYTKHGFKKTGESYKEVYEGEVITDLQMFKPIIA